MRFTSSDVTGGGGVIVFAMQVPECNNPSCHTTIIYSVGENFPYEQQ